MEQSTPSTEAMYEFPYEDLHDFATSTISEFCDLLETLRRQGQPAEPEGRALWTWSSVLGTLACDLADSAVRSIDAGDLRAATLVNRSLYEYVNRLRYFGIHRDDAIRCCQEGIKFYDRMHEVVLSDVHDEVLPLDTANSMKLQSIGGMLSDYLQKSGGNPDSSARYRRHFHDGFYAAASALAHGSQGAIMDAYRIIKMGDAQTVEWMKRRDPNLRPAAMCTLGLMLVLMIAAIEEFGIVTGAPPKWHHLLNRYKEFADELVTFKERHAAIVGYFRCQ